MEYSRLGNSELQVSRICVGCMSFGDSASNFHSWTLDADESEVLVKDCRCHIEKTGDKYDYKS